MRILAEHIEYLDESGKLVTESLRGYSKRTVRKHFAGLNDFLGRWNTAERKEAVIEELENEGLLLEPLADEVGKECSKRCSRSTRTRGSSTSTTRRSSRSPPFDAMGTPVELLRSFGDRDGFERAVRGDVPAPTRGHETIMKVDDNSFFIHEPVPDQRYRYLRDHDFFAEAEARQFVERIWPQCRAYLDADFRKKASEHFEARFWEMYLVHTLLQNGIWITPRSSRAPTEGPDILLADGVTFIEAVLATAGCGRDAVSDPPSRRGVHSGLPDDQMKLRSLVLDVYDSEKFVGSCNYYRKGSPLTSENKLRPPSP